MMEKFIIIAGAVSVGKTLASNKLISKMLSKGYVVDKYFNDGSKPTFWNILNNGKPVGGSVVLGKEYKKISLVGYGDCIKDLDTVFAHLDFNDYYAVVCCSRTRATREVFDYFHNNILPNIDVTKTQVVPIYKDLMAHNNRDNDENISIADTILTILEN